MWEVWYRTHQTANVSSDGRRMPQMRAKNHFARVCQTKTQSKPIPKVHSVEENISDDDESDMYVATIENSTETKDWKATIKVNDRHTTFKLDTGAQLCNVISKKTYDQISKRPLLKSKTKLVTFSGHKLKACGKASMVCEYKQKLNVVEFEEVQQNVPSVLGLKTCKEMKLVQRIDSIGTKSDDLLEEYKDVFEGLGCITNTTYQIKIDPTKIPLYTHPIESLLPSGQRSRMS